MKTISNRFRAAAFLIVLILLLLPISQALGEVLGPNNPGTAVNNTAVGTVPWTNPGNITVPGFPYAIASFSNQPNQLSNNLLATSYGFNIPVGATITGITVVINRFANNVSSNITDHSLYLVLNNAYTGNNKADTTTSWLDILGPATYGGPTDLWGAAWTPADINDPSFGVALSVNKGSNGNRSASVDSIQITVDYSVNNTTTVDCGSGTPVTTYGSSITCVATVTATTTPGTPSGTVSWTTGGSGSFVTSPCTLSGAGGTSTCSVTYTPSAVGSGSHLISAIYSGDGVFLSSSNNQTVIVNQRPVTVTADAQAKVYGDADPALTYQVTSGSLVAGDTFTGALTRVAGEAVGTYAIQQGTLVLSNNYDLTYVGANLTINQRPITVTADAKSKIYGDPDPALTYQVTSGSLAAGDAFTGALTRVAGEALGAYAIQQGTLALSSNYNLTYVGASLTITQRPVTVTADAKFKAYGDPDPALTYQVTSGSLAAGDAFTGALTRVAGEALGTYAIQQGTLALSSNYDLTYVGANLTINQRLVTVTADAKSKVYGNPDPALTYQVTSGSLAAGDAFTGALTRTPGETVGIYPISQGSLALSANYDLTYIGANLTIIKATPTLSVTNSPVLYNGSPQAAVVVGSVNGAVSNILYNGFATTPTNPGTYAVTADFAPSDAANYNSLVGAPAGDFVISPAFPELTLEVTPTPATFGKAGTLINYSYRLTNSGAGTLVGPFSVDDDIVTVTCPATASLAPGASITCNSWYTITLADVVAGYVTNSATGSGSFAGNPIISSLVPTTVTAYRLFQPLVFK